MLMVSSWGDLAMRVLFALSTVTNLNNMKSLLSARDTSSTKTLISSKSMTTHGIAAIVPLISSLVDVKSAYKRSKLLQVESWFTPILFFTLGIMILAFHLYVELIPTFSQCEMQIKPWFSSRPSCSFLVLNCYEAKLSGTESEVTAQWSPFDPETILSLVIRHCPTLEMPSKLTEFSGLKVLKVYNSTITSWQESAVISQAHHPGLIMLFLARVNMTNGELPAGLYRQNLPSILQSL